MDSVRDERANGDVAAYVVLSADSDVRKTFEAWGIPAPLTLKDLVELRDALSGLPPEGVAAGVEVEILGELDPSKLNISIANLPQVRMALADLGYPGMKSAQIEVVSPTLAIGIADAREYGRTGTISGRLLYTSQLLVSTTSDDFEDAKGPTAFITQGCRVVQKISVRTDEEGSMTIVPVGLAKVDTPFASWDSPAEAFDRVYDALLDVPGFNNLQLTEADEVESLDDRRATYEEFTTTLDVATLVAGDTNKGPWSLEIAIIAKQGGATFERIIVECETDPAAPGMWRLNGMEPMMSDAQPWDIAAWVTAGLSCIYGGIGDPFKV